MLVTISMTTAVNIKKEKKETPLFKIRTRESIKNKGDTIKEKIRSHFIYNRVFFVPLKIPLTKLIQKIRNNFDLVSCTDCSYWTCDNTFCRHCTSNSDCTWKTCQYPTQDYTCPGQTWLCTGCLLC